MATTLKPLESQVIVITGASSGIGLATALAAAARGAIIVAVARSGDTLEALRHRIEQTGGRVMVGVADVADRAALEEIAARAVERFGRIDTWVNNAGITIYGRLEDHVEEDARRLFDTNFWGMVNGSLTALPYLRRQGGVLVNMGSIASEMPVPLQGMYTASKHAIKGFTDTLRVEVEMVEGAPVEVVLIQPTVVDTPIAEHAGNYMEREPKELQPAMDPEEVVEAILEAAEEGGRDIKVGASAKIGVALSHIVPGLAERVASTQIDTQKRDVAEQDPAGALYRASEDGRIHGSH